MLATTSLIARAVPLPPPCEGEGLRVARIYGANATLSAAFDASAVQVVAWQERADAAGGHMVSPYRSHLPAERLVVCFYDGAFTNIAHQGGPPGPGMTPVPNNFERIVLLIGPDRTPQLRAAGPKAQLQIVDPTR